MRPTRQSDLLLTGLIGAVLVYLLVRLSYGSLPGVPLLAGVTLLVLAVAEVLLGNTLRARIQGRPGSEPVQPLLAARAVTVAKASSLAGAIMAGAWLGLLGYVLPLLSEIDAAGSDTAGAALGLVSAVALVGAGLWLEHCCRTPEPPASGDNDGP